MKQIRGVPITSTLFRPAVGSGMRNGSALRDTFVTPRPAFLRCESQAVGGGSEQGGINQGNGLLEARLAAGRIDRGKPGLPAAPCVIDWQRTAGVVAKASCRARRMASENQVGTPGGRFRGGIAHGWWLGKRRSDAGVLLPMGFTTPGALESASWWRSLSAADHPPRFMQG